MMIVKCHLLYLEKSGYNSFLIMFPKISHKSVSLNTACGLLILNSTSHNIANVFCMHGLSQYVKWFALYCGPIQKFRRCSFTVVCQQQQGLFVHTFL